MGPYTRANGPKATVKETEILHTLMAAFLKDAGAKENITVRGSTGQSKALNMTVSGKMESITE